MSKNDYKQWNNYLLKSYSAKENVKFFKQNSAVNITVLFWYLFLRFLHCYYGNNTWVHVRCSHLACRWCCP